MLKLLKEETDKKDSEENIEIVEDPEEMDTKQDISIEEVSDEVSNKACEDVILTLVKEVWALISQTNGALATLDYNYEKDNKDEIKNILNTLVDDLTINVGMLYKISDMMNEKTEKLLDAGVEKAEEVAAAE